MQDNATVVTFSGTTLHREYQKDFHKTYSNYFGNHVDYTFKDIVGTDFYNNNLEIFSYKKYSGYFLWKPYIIWKTLQFAETRYVIYCDSNVRFTNFHALKEEMHRQLVHQGVFFVKHAHFTNREWTKRDAFILMDADVSKYWDAPQVWTPVMAFDKSLSTQTLISDYMKFCQVPEIITELPNTCGKDNLDGFREHRWEQSVMSILARKYNYEGVPDTTSVNWVTKYYPPELIKQKEEENANPLAKSL